MILRNSLYFKIGAVFILVLLLTSIAQSVLIAVNISRIASEDAVRRASNVVASEAQKFTDRDFVILKDPSSLDAEKEEIYRRFEESVSRLTSAGAVLVRFWDEDSKLIANSQDETGIVNPMIAEGFAEASLGIKNVRVVKSRDFDFIPALSGENFLIVYEPVEVIALGGFQKKLVSIIEVVMNWDQITFSIQRAQIYEIGLVILFSVLSLALLFFSIKKFMLDPIGDLRKDAIRIREGEKNVEIRYRSNDELGSLGDTIRSLLQVLRNTVGELDVKNIELEQKVSESEKEREYLEKIKTATLNLLEDPP